MRLWMANISMTQALWTTAPDGVAAPGAGYLARLAGFLDFGVCGSGGVASMRRRSSSARFSASSLGSKSDSSTSRLDGRGLFMAGSVRRG